MKKILIATHVRFWLEDKGSSKRISSLIRFFCSKNISVHVYYAGFVDNDTLKKIERTYDDLFFYADNYNGRNFNLVIFKKFTARALASFSRRFEYGTFFGEIQPKGFASKYRYYRKSRFNEIKKDVRPNSIIVEYVSLAYLIEDIYYAYENRPLLLIDTHDILYLRYQSFKNSGLSHWVEISREQEISYLSKFDIVIAIQEREKKILEDMLPGKTIIEVAYPCAVKKHGKVGSLPLKIGYVGTSSAENQDAITGFIENIWLPLRKKFNESLSLDIYGKICDVLEGYRDIDGINIYGRFEDLEAVYDNLDIVINPIRSGGGIKVKNVEALCHSMPLLTTDCGSQGLERGKNDAFLCGNAYDEQFEQLSRLIASPELRAELSLKAYAFARREFNEAKCYNELLDVIKRY